MKKILLALFSVLFVLINGCSDSATGSGTDPFGGGGGTGGVTIQVQGQADGQGKYLFNINPSVAINLAKVKVSVTAQQYEETIDINSQFQAGSFQGCLEYPANVIQTGTQFTFLFTGTTVNGNQNFSVTTNYTTP